MSDRLAPAACSPLLMRLVLLIYLAVYTALVMGASWALWQGGVLMQLPPSWVFLALLLACGFGLLLALTSLRTLTSSD